MLPTPVEAATTALVVTDPPARLPESSSLGVSGRGSGALHPGAGKTGSLGTVRPGSEHPGLGSLWGEPRGHALCTPCPDQQSQRWRADTGLAGRYR